MKTVTPMLAALLLALTHTAYITPSAAAGSECSEDVDFRNATQTCKSTPSAETDHVSGGKKHDIRIEPICAITTDSTCGQSVNCTTANGTQGTYYSLTIDGVPQDNICLGPNEANDAGIITPADVQRAWQDLDWPASDLHIQPPDATTLVNFDTNFYTTNTQPITQTVTLLDQAITIEATPARYLWAFGDDTTDTTTDPGAPYPALRVTHNYTRKGTYAPALATTYTGRYHVGDGPWQAIPGTITITGPAQTLRAIEAQPQLVGY